MLHGFREGLGQCSEKSIAMGTEKKKLPKFLVKAVMNLYESSNTKFKVRSKFSKEFSTGVGVHQGSVLSPFVVCNCCGCCDRECKKKGLMKEVLHADDLKLKSETMAGLKKSFLKWISALERKELKVNLKKIKVWCVCQRVKSYKVVACIQPPPVIGD